MIHTRITFLLVCVTTCFCTHAHHYMNQIALLSSQNVRANQTCPDDQMTIQALHEALNQFNTMQDRISGLNRIIVCNLFVTFIALTAYVPLLYITYNQLTAAEKRINQIAPI